MFTLFLEYHNSSVVLMVLISARAILKMPYVMRELVNFIDEKETVLECHRRTSATKRSDRARTASCLRYMTLIAVIV